MTGHGGGVVRIEVDDVGRRDVGASTPRELGVIDTISSANGVRIEESEKQS
jgi:hypothetical protein